jgi:hypothetical protein
LPEMVSVFDGIALRKDLSSFQLIDFLVCFRGLDKGNGIGFLSFLGKGVVPGKKQDKKENRREQESRSFDVFQLLPLFS